MKRKRLKKFMGPKPAPSVQGMSHLGTYRLPFSEDVKHRSRQKHENRRPHRLRGQAGPDSILGAPDLHWSEPPRMTSRLHSWVTARRSEPKHESITPPGGVLDHAGPRVRRGKR